MWKMLDLDFPQWVGRDDVNRDRSCEARPSVARSGQRAGPAGLAEVRSQPGGPEGREAHWALATHREALWIKGDGPGKLKGRGGEKSGEKEKESSGWNARMIYHTHNPLPLLFLLSILLRAKENMTTQYLWIYKNACRQGHNLHPRSYLDITACIDLCCDWFRWFWMFQATSGGKGSTFLEKFLFSGELWQVPIWPNWLPAWFSL